MGVDLDKGEQPEIVGFFIDEAGTPTLFGRRGKIVVESGTSRYFILGKLEVGHPASLTRKLNALRGDLLADPYFRSVPSMQPEAQKTALICHAKDDVPEVRERVFRLLMSRVQKSSQWI